MSISLSKWPMLPTIAWCFIFSKCSTVMMSKLPVVVMKMSAVSTTELEALDLVAVHRGLQRADRVDLGDDDAGALAAQRLRGALADVAVAADDGDLAADHDVGGAVDAVDQRVAAAVLVVELALGDRVVDVDRREEQRALPEAVVQAEDAGGGLLGDALDVLRRWWSSAAGRSPASGPGRAAPPCTPRCRWCPATARRRPSRTRRPCAASSVMSPPSSRSTFGPSPFGEVEDLLGLVPVLGRASRPSRRRPGCPAGRRRCRSGRRRPRRPRGPGWRRCCTSPSGRRRRAPSSVSMRTAVWIVMCSEPAMRAPASGLSAP